MMTYMFGQEAGNLMNDCECRTCRRIIPMKTHDKPPGNDGMIWCFECFSQWYDGDLAHPDNLDPIKIGNFVRAKHGLPPLEASP